MLPMFAGRMLPFDLTCTTAYAELLAKVHQAGGGIETADACIAAVAIANGLSVATRDGNPFRPAGLVVIDPWKTARKSDRSGAGGGAVLQDVTPFIPISIFRTIFTRVLAVSLLYFPTTAFHNCLSALRKSIYILSVF